MSERWFPTVGERIQRVGHNSCGIVREFDFQALRVLVWWGTKTQSEGRAGIEVLEWLNSDDVEVWPHTVITAEEIAERELCQREAEIRGA